MNRTADGDQQEVVCRRELKRLANGAEYPVTVIVLAARQFRARHEDHFECAYQIKGLGSHLDLADQDTHTDKALGVDSVQALLLAFAAIHEKLRPHEPGLAFLGERGNDGFPLILSYSNDYGPEFREHIRTLVEQETERFLIRKYGKDRISPRRRGTSPS
jgi:hypothetical protein